MREPVLTGKIEPTQTEERELLVLGTEGTLRVDPAFTATTPATLPLWMETLVEPLVASARLRLEARVPTEQRAFAGEPILPDSLERVLRDRLQGILTQAMGAWCETTDAPPSVDDLLRTFPTLDSLLRGAVAEWVGAVAAFLGRLHWDGPRLAGWLGLEAMPRIAAVSGAASDLHPGGHFVIRVAFRGGLCLYYKPRPVTGEWLWHELVAAVGIAEPALYLPAARVMAGGDDGRYGWAESVLPGEGLAAEGLERGVEDSNFQADYWQAAGAMLCLAQHARLTDLHMGNLLATSMGPAVTDAECLGTPELLETKTPAVAEIDAVLDSLLDTGLLPRPSASALPDTSGFFGSASSVDGFALPRWTVAADGRCRLTRAPAALRDHGNTPGGMSPIAVLSRLMSGYRHTTEVLIAIRDVLIAPGSRWRLVLERLHAPRVVVRDTLSYGVLLSQSLGPKNLRTASGRRNALFGALRKSSPVALPAALARAELRALLHLHVPRFAMLAGTRTLANGSGRSLVRGYAGRPSAAGVLRSLEELSAERLESTHIPALLLAVLSDRGPSRAT
jgi:lantibiotic modifying enzyme